MPEQIVCFDQSCLDTVGRFQGFTDNLTKYMVGLFVNPSIQFRLVDREEAELDTSIKQLATYTIFMDPVTRKVFVYNRSKVVGEDRLAGKVSVGVGGHVNELDLFHEEINVLSIMDDIFCATEREIKEETSEIDSIESVDMYPIMIGFVNDDSNPVGKVHFGIVSICFTPEGSIHPNDPALLNPRFQTIDNLLNYPKENIESWSVIVLEYLREHI